MKTPNAYVRLVRKDYQNYVWIIDCCPLCGKSHIHGAGDDLEEISQYLGHRMSHCDTNEKSGYNLVRIVELL
jgi:hypothetical protein